MLAPTEDALAKDGLMRREELETVYRNELRLLRLVNSLLDFSRIEAGRTRAHYEPTDLGRLTADLASTFRSAIERGGLQFEVDTRPCGGRSMSTVTCGRRSCSIFSPTPSSSRCRDASASTSTR